MKEQRPKQSEKTTQPERLTRTVDEAAALLGISRNTAYDMAAAGRLPTIRMGRRLLVPKAALEKLLQAV